MPKIPQEFRHNDLKVLQDLTELHPLEIEVVSDVGRGHETPAGGSV